MGVMETSTFALAHLDADFGDSSTRRTMGQQNNPAAPVALSAVQAKFGAKSLELSAGIFAGVYWPGGAPFIDGKHANIDCWVRFKSHPGGTPRMLVCSGPIGGGVLVFGIRTLADGTLQAFFTDGGNIPWGAAAAAPAPLNQWIHVAASFDSARSLRLYVNGVMTAVVNVTGTIIGTELLYNNFIIGGPNTSFGYAPDAYIDEARYVWQLPVYGAYAPLQTAPFPDSAPSDPSFASVSLLLHGEGSEGGTVITDSSSNALVPTQSGSSGNVTTSTAHFRFGSRALQFSGTNSLAYASSPLFNLASASELTIELWAYIATGSGSDPFLFQIGNDINNRLVCYYTVSGNNLTFYSVSGGTGGQIMNVIGDIRDTWTHIALVKTGTLWTAFVNGTPRASVVSPNIPTGSSLQMEVGRDEFSNNAAWYYKGAMDEFRITQGVARYNLNFTPPSAPYTDAAAPAAQPLPPVLAHQAGAFGGVVPKALPAPAAITDLYFGGRGKISGTVKVKGTPNAPTHRRVRLLRDRDGLLARETWSDAATGDYLFTNIDETQRYTVVTYDYEHNFRAVIADNLTPDLMP